MAPEHFSTRERWPRMMIFIGSIGMILGGIDPLEGSVLILPGSGLIALGFLLSHE